MSDSVHISGIDFGGDIPEWATSKTQEALLKEAKKYHKESSATFKALKKLLEDYKKLYQQNTKDQKKANSGGSDLAKSNKNLAAEIASLKDSIKSIDRARASDGLGKKGGGKTGKGGLSAVAADLEAKSPSGKLLEKGGKALEKYTTPTTAAGKAASELGGAFGKLEKSIVGGVVLAFEFLYEQLMATSRAYSSIYSTGAVLGTTMDGMITGQKELIAAQVSSGVEMDKYTDIIKKHGAVISRVGIKGFSAMGNTMTNAAMSFGMSAEQGTEYMADYLDQQRLAGILSDQDNKRTAEAAAEQLKSTMQFSRALGVSREEIEAARKKESESIDFQAVLASVPEEMRKNLLNVQPQLQKAMDMMGEEGSTIFKQALLDPANARTTEAYKHLAPAQKEYADSIISMAEATRNGEITQKNVYDRIGKTIGTFDKSTETAARMTLVGARLHEKGYLSVAATSLKVDQAQKQMSKGLWKFGEDINAKTAPTIDAALTTIRSAFTTGFGAILSDPKFTAALQKLADNFKQYGPQLATALVEFASKGIPVLLKMVDWLNGLFKKTDGGKLEFDWAHLLEGVILNPVTAAYAIGKVAINMMLSKVKSIASGFGKILNTGSLGEIASGLMKSVGKLFFWVTMIFDTAKGIFDGAMKAFDDFKNGNILKGFTDILLGAVLGLADGIADIFIKLPLMLVRMFAQWLGKHEWAKKLGIDGEFLSSMEDRLGTMKEDAFNAVGAGQPSTTNPVTQPKKSDTPPPVETPPVRTEINKSDEAKETPASQNQSTMSNADQDTGVDTAAASNAINSGDSAKILAEMLKLNEQMVRYLYNIQRHTRTTADGMA